MMMAIKDVAVSLGLGLHVGSLEPSLRPAGARRRRGAGALELRFGLGRFNTEEEVDYVADPSSRRSSKLREMSPLYEMAQGRHRSEEHPVGSALTLRPRLGEKSEQTHGIQRKVIEHYENPRNVGTLDKNDPNVGTGLVGAPACGDVMRLQIKVNDDGVIEDAKFKTFGCGSAIASARRSPPSGSRARPSTRPRRSRTRRSPRS